MNLQFVDPGLYEVVMAAADDERRAAVRVACDVARRSTGLSGPAVDMSAEALERERYGDGEEARAMRLLAERLQAEDVEREGPGWYQAQAARAYAFALLPQAKRAADRAIGSAIVAVGHEADVIGDPVRTVLAREER